MLEANKPGVLETVSIKDHTKCKRFEFDLNKFPNLQVLVGKNIGDKFKKSDISKSCVQENEDEEYEIVDDEEEFEGMEDALRGIRIGCDNLKRFINQ